MEEPGVQTAPSTAAFYILITSHNKTGGNQVQAGGGEAINGGSGEKREEVIEEGGMKSEEEFFGHFGFNAQQRGSRLDLEVLIQPALIYGWMHTEYLMVLELWKVFKAVGKRISAVLFC